jgi:cell division protein FtsB
MTVTLTIVLAELCLVLVIALAVIAVRALRRRRRDRAAVETLVTSIKAQQPARVEKLAEALKNSAQFNDEDALSKANEFIRKQNRFYQDAIDLYFTRNHEVLSKLDGRLEELLSQYQALTTPGEGHDNAKVEQLSKDIASLSRDLESLRTENATLTEQLKAAEHELDQLGREYVSAFNRPKGGAVGPPAAEQVHEMETGNAEWETHAEAQTGAEPEAVVVEEAKSEDALTDMDLIDLLEEPEDGRVAAKNG